MIWKYVQSDEYLELVRRFPLVPISSRAQHEQAMAMLQELAVSDAMSKAESDYFDVLSGLVCGYEEGITKPVKVTPQAALEFLMEQHRLTQADISKLTDMQRSHVSEFLAGRRNLPRRAANSLAAQFQVDAALFLPRFEAAKSLSPRRIDRTTTA